MSIFANVKVDEGIILKCLVPDGLSIHQDDSCIIKTEKMLDSGHVVRLEEHPSENNEKFLPRVERCATLQDQAKIDEDTLLSKIAFDSCTANAEKNGLDMRLVSVRYSFDRSVLVVTFSAEERVDFREFVKEIAAELRTRVEMIQVGVRDQAGLIGGIGPCGRKMCCCSWLEKFESINVKMAKAQKLSLNPAGISGMCGRLKCCLNYECEQYKEMGKNLPREGSRCDTPEGPGRVISQDVLSQRLRVKFDDDRIKEFNVDELGKNPVA